MRNNQATQERVAKRFAQVMSVKELKFAPIHEVLSAYAHLPLIQALMRGDANMSSDTVAFDRLRATEISRNRYDIIGVSSREECTALFRRLYAAGFNCLQAANLQAIKRVSK